MLKMQRTHTLREDQRWIPASVRRMRHAASISMVAFSSAMVSSTLFAPWLLAFWKPVALSGVGLFLVGDRLAKQHFAQTVKKLGKEIPLLELHRQSNDQMVLVEGVIEASETLEGILRKGAGVYRRMRFGKWIHEAAVDFTLVSDDGERVPVQVAGAKWITEFREPFEYPVTSFFKQDTPILHRILANKRGRISADESILKVGQRVQIVGMKGVRPDVEGQSAGMRMPPERAVLYAGPQLPLLISCVGEAV